MLLPLFSGCLDLDITSISGTPVQVDIWQSQTDPVTGGQSGKYWVGSAIVSGSPTASSLIATMPAGTADNDQYTTQEVKIQISNINPYWEAPVEIDYSNPLTYKWVHTTWWDDYLNDGPVPYLNVGPGVMVTSYKVTVDTGRITTPSAIGSSYHAETSSPVVDIPVKDPNGITRHIYVKLVNAITFPTGTLPPASTGYSVLDGKRLVEYSDLEGGIYDWNQYAANEYFWKGGVPFVSTAHVDSWDDAYTWMDDNNKIPGQSQKLGASLSMPSDQKVRLTYPTNTFAPEVVFYIPEEIAETVAIQEPAPHIVFDRIKDIEGQEGGTYTLKITGHNVGSPGEVNFNIKSDAISSVTFHPSPNPYIIDDFSIDAYMEFSENIAEDKTFTATATAQGGLGEQTSEEFKITLTDTAGMVVPREPYKPGGTDEPTDITNIVYIILIAIILLALWYFGIVDYLLNMVTSNPVIAVLIIIIIVLIWLGIQIQNFTDAVSSGAESINPFNWLKGD